MRRRIITGDEGVEEEIKQIYSRRTTDERCGDQTKWKKMRNERSPVAGYVRILVNLALSFACVKANKAGERWGGVCGRPWVGETVRAGCGGGAGRGWRGGGVLRWLSHYAVSDCVFLSYYGGGRGEGGAGWGGDCDGCWGSEVECTWMKRRGAREEVVVEG